MVKYETDYDYVEKGFGLGQASYHFSLDRNCYINYENLTIKTDDGQNVS